jgi:hypothetical protein
MKRLRTNAKESIVKSIRIRAFWDDGKDSYYSLETLQQDRKARQLVLSHWERYIKSPEATRGDREGFKNLLLFLARDEPVSKRLEELAKSLNRIWRPSCKDYNRSVAGIFERYNLSPPESCFPGLVIVYGDGNEACGLEYNDWKWSVRDNGWVKANAAPPPERPTSRADNVIPLRRK